MKYVVALCFPVAFTCAVVYAWLNWSRRLVKHQGLSRDEFLAYFRRVGLTEQVPAAIYDYFQQSMGRNFSPAPNDSLRDIYAINVEDVKDTLGEIVQQLGYEMPHSGVLSEWSPVETLEDVARFADWIRTKHQTAVSGGESQ
jgi:hypothetical protein